MAEFCVKCWNELNGTRYNEKDYVLTKYPELCEGCGEYKKVIVKRKSDYIGPYGGLLLVPIYIVILIVMLIWKSILFLIRCFKRMKSKGQESSKK